MKYIYKILILSGLLFFAACSEFDENLENPIEVTPDNVNVNDLYNSVQLSMGGIPSATWYFPASYARMVAQTSSFQYVDSQGPNSFNGIWTNVYANLWTDIQILEGIAEERGLAIHEGTAKVMKAYSMMVMVDMFGDIPFSDATQGVDIISPTAQSGAEVYAAAVALLDEAIALLGTADAPPLNYDNFYDGDASKWIAAANTLKLRAAVTTRLIDPSGSASTINSLITQDIIDTEDEDFQVNFGSNRENPNSRHPLYNNSYENTDGDYMSNYYMWMLRADKLDDNGNPVVDPRIRYYFYRQVEKADELDGTVYSCFYSVFPTDTDARPAHYDAVDPRLPYCISFPGDGYFGRDHLNFEGIPPDGPLRTIYGLYPAGGQFDDNSFTSQQQTGVTGALGQGIWPIMLASFTDFMRAEAALTLGTNDDPRALLESGMRKSIAKVQGFADRDPNSFTRQIDQRGTLISVEDAFVPDADEVDAYVDFVLSRYDAADADGKLDILMREYYISLWGNGIEAYNMYRRTGKPNNMMPALEANPGEFVRSFLYPAVNVDRNANATQKSVTDRVFWDDGSINLY
mgnify:CR=1 FL=1